MPRISEPVRPNATGAIPVGAITAVILAGGQARRMGGADKGLVELGGKSLVARLIDNLRPQAGTLLISANRNLGRYRNYGHPVITDATADYRGPLAGIASALRETTTPYLLTVPCDTPLLPDRLAARLYRALAQTGMDIAAVHDGERLQPLCALLRVKVLPDLLEYLDGGGRRVDAWQARLRLTTVDCSGTAGAFLNLNTPLDVRKLEQRLAAPLATGNAVQ